MTLNPSLPSPGGAQLPAHVSVLVLDDQRFDRHKLSRLCSGLPIDCTVTQADSLAALNIQLDTAVFDLIFVDYNLPDGSGIDALEMVQLSPRNCHAASIMVTGYEEESIALEAMSRGCADYITKDELAPSSFERAVTNALQKSMLSTQVQSQTFARAEVERVLHRFANQCATDIKPMISRMMRQLRDLRDAAPNDAATILSRRESVEASCMHLWEFLEDLEKHQAGVLLKDMAPTVTPTPAARRPRTDRHLPPPPIEAAALTNPPAQGRKRPPSPFSRVQH